MSETSRPEEDPRFGSAQAARKDESIALAGAVLFLVHPRNVETVSIIANQTGLLCTFFCLLSLVLWARLLEGTRRPLPLYSMVFPCSHSCWPRSPKRPPM